MSLRSLFTRLFPVLVLGAFVAACDNEPRDAAQPLSGQDAHKPAAGAGVQLAGKIDRSHAGDLMRDALLRDPNGREMRLAAMQGQPVLLNLWATWCAPCVKEMPMLDRLAGEMKDRLRVVTVSQDIGGADKVAAFFARLGFRQLEPWMDPDGDLGFAYGGNLPVTILFDSMGRELLRVEGGYEWDSPAARAQIEQALSEAGK